MQRIIQFLFKVANDIRVALRPYMIRNVIRITDIYAVVTAYLLHLYLLYIKIRIRNSPNDKHIIYAEAISDDPTQDTLSTNKSFLNYSPVHVNITSEVDYFYRYVVPAGIICGVARLQQWLRDCGHHNKTIRIFYRVTNDIYVARIDLDNDVEQITDLPIANGNISLCNKFGAVIHPYI